MAKDTKTKTKSKEPDRDPDMPEGFAPLGRTRVNGWFVREAGNAIQGIIRDSFVVKSKKPRFPDKKVYVIELTGGATQIMNGDGNVETIDEGTVGLDETGYLKKLAQLEPQAEVFIKCMGKEEDTQQAPWVFKIGVAGGKIPF